MIQVRKEEILFKAIEDSVDGIMGAQNFSCSDGAGSLKNTIGVDASGNGVVIIKGAQRTWA